MWLQVRMYLLVALLFGIVYALVTVVSVFLGFANFLFFGVLASVLLFAQYWVGPKIVEWSMKVKYVSESEDPELHKMVEELSKKAGIPKPRVGVSPLQLPNAFAFGRWRSDGRVCVTEGMRKLVKKEELKAVMGHEISHLVNRDVTVITMISVIPTISWYLAWSSMFSRERDSSAIGVVALVIYFITNLLVLYASRIREYYADRGAVKLGQEPHHLASALYKLVYSSARFPKQSLKQVEGMKAFFANDPSRAHAELSELSQVDADLSGHIDKEELEAVRSKDIKLTAADRMLEIFSTHPNMLKRIRALSEIPAQK